MSRSTPLWKQAEKDFESFMNARGKKAYVHRLTDTAQAKATGGKKAFVVNQPSDYLGVLDGNTFFGEVKSSANPTSFPYSNIKKTQLAHARRIIAAGGSYLFFIKSFVLDKWYIVPAQVVINNKTSKSSKWTALAQYEWDPYELS
tara:strand:+ start:2652 stop:3086 length:435 start_codon:yes stop_codon:yes gene_type:complete